MKPYLLSLGLLTAASLAALGGAASADVLPGPGPGGTARRPLIPSPPQQQPVNRDPVALARRNPVIAEKLKELRGEGGPGPVREETAVQVALSGQCGFAGCGQSTLVAFTVRSQGANTTTRSLLALVSCGPVGECQVEQAEVKAVAQLPTGKPVPPVKPTPPVMVPKPQPQR